MIFRKSNLQPVKDYTGRDMKIAFVSGKGGAGKTTVSNNIAAVIPDATLIDCDVEEPNSHILLRETVSQTHDYTVGYPVVNQDVCIHCRNCAEFCRYNAILANDKVTVPMNDLCHDCGGCLLVCPSGAISYEQRSIGKIIHGTAATGNPMVHGVLNIGENSGVRIIKEVKSITQNDALVLIDSPPGTACSAVTAVEDVDHVIIVTEPTPFGVSDMKMVVEMLHDMELPFSVIINKAGIGNNEIYEYCTKEAITIIGEIPFDMTMATTYASGKLIAEASDEFHDLFLSIWNKIEKTLGDTK